MIYAYLNTLSLYLLSTNKNQTLNYIIMLLLITLIYFYLGISAYISKKKKADENKGESYDLSPSTVIIFYSLYCFIVFGITAAYKQKTTVYLILAPLLIIILVIYFIYLIKTNKKSFPDGKSYDNKFQYKVVNIDKNKIYNENINEDQE